MSGWRDALDDRPSEDALMELSPEHRIALALALLAGTGVTATILPDDWAGDGEYATGWNDVLGVCRDAARELQEDVNDADAR